VLQRLAISFQPSATSSRGFAALAARCTEKPHPMADGRWLMADGSQEMAVSGWLKADGGRLVADG
jgi:hypothetical protein